MTRATPMTANSSGSGEALRACPGCGTFAGTLDDGQRDELGILQVTCRNCGWVGPSSDNDDDKVAASEAIAAWNTRTPSEAKPDQADIERQEYSRVDDEISRAFIDGWNARLDHSSFDMALHYWMLALCRPLSPSSDAVAGVDR